jgi:hypothetical protein
VLEALKDVEARSQTPNAGTRFAKMDVPATIMSTTPSLTELTTSISWPSWLSGKNWMLIFSSSLFALRFLIRKS